jgi:hypothetical protein
VRNFTFLGTGCIVSRIIRDTSLLCSESCAPDARATIQCGKAIGRCVSAVELNVLGQCPICTSARIGRLGEEEGEDRDEKAAHFVNRKFKVLKAEVR